MPLATTETGFGSLITPGCYFKKVVDSIELLNKIAWLEHQVGQVETQSPSSRRRPFQYREAASRPPRGLTEPPTTESSDHRRLASPLYHLEEIFSKHVRPRSTRSSVVVSPFSENVCYTLYPKKDLC